jgi:hypothetical protein
LGWSRLWWRWALESGGNLIVGGGGLCCDFSGEGRVLFYRLRGSRTDEWGVETKSRELNSGIEPSRHSRSTEKMLWKRVVVSHRILTFWPHWHTTKGVTYLSSYGYGLKRRLSWVCLSRYVKPTLWERIMRVVGMVINPSCTQIITSYMTCKPRILTLGQPHWFCQKFSWNENLCFQFKNFKQIYRSLARVCANSVVRR